MTPFPVTVNILNRTFYIRYEENLGTGFTIDIDDQQYLVTAKHVVEGIQDGDHIYLMHNDKWYGGAVNIAWMPPQCAEEDIAILLFQEELLSEAAYPVIVNSAGLYLGQDVYFLGYPYKMRMRFKEMKGGWPLPLVKKGIVSGFGGKKGPELIYIDGHNNPGFSGGPVIFGKAGDEHPHIAGVISGYKRNYEHLIDIENKKEPQIMNRYITYGNTGIIFAYALGDGVKYIRANPKRQRPEPIAPLLVKKDI